MSDDRLPGGSQPSRGRRDLIIALAAAMMAVALISGAFSERAATPAGDPLPAAATPTPPAPARPTPSAPPEPALVPTFDRAAHSIDDPASIWVVVNKQRPLGPPDFIPPDLVAVPVPYVWQARLRPEASDAVVALFAAFATETGLRLQLQSAYRGYDAQVRVYNRGVQANGRASADSSIARPGSSEHQTGLAIDISTLPSTCSLSACFGDTPHGQWLAANAWRYGFLLRYPADKVQVTGYEFEPWHFRYIGVGLATEMHDTGVTTLEEFFGLPAAPGYD